MDSQERRKKYYFVSDVHLMAVGEGARELEDRFVRFLDAASKDAAAIYLLGDIFDYWYEYKYVIPSGYTRVLGKLAQICDSGIPVYFFKGNHDIWAYGYFEREIGMKVLEQPYVATMNGARICMGHGDGLGKTEAGFAVLRWIFHNRFLQWLFSGIHPRWSVAFGYRWAAHSRNKKSGVRQQFKCVGGSIYKFADAFGRTCAREKGEGIDFYIFGHYHHPSRVTIPSGGEMVILGSWLEGGEYAVFDAFSGVLTVEENRF